MRVVSASVAWSRLDRLPVQDGLSVDVSRNHAMLLDLLRGVSASERERLADCLAGKIPTAALVGLSRMRLPVATVEHHVVHAPKNHNDLITGLAGLGATLWGVYSGDWKIAAAGFGVGSLGVSAALGHPINRLLAHAPSRKAEREIRQAQTNASFVRELAHDLDIACGHSGRPLTRSPEFWQIYKRVCASPASKWPSQLAVADSVEMFAEAVTIYLGVMPGVSSASLRENQPALWQFVDTFFRKTLPSRLHDVQREAEHVRRFPPQIEAQKQALNALRGLRGKPTEEQLEALFAKADAYQATPADQAARRSLHVRAVSRDYLDTRSGRLAAQHHSSRS